LIEESKGFSNETAVEKRVVDSEGENLKPDIQEVENEEDFEDVDTEEVVENEEEKDSKPKPAKKLKLKLEGSKEERLA